MSADQSTPPVPALRLIRGDATAEEIAAIVAVLAAGSGGGDEPVAAPGSRWAAPADRLRRPLQHGPGAWHASARLR